MVQGFEETQGIVFQSPDVTTISQLCNQQLIPKDPQRSEEIRCTSVMISFKALIIWVSSLLRLLFHRLRQVGKRGGICSGQNLILIRMMTCVQVTECSPKKFTTLRVLFGASVISNLSEVTLIRPKDPSIPELPSVRRRPQSGTTLHHSEIFPIPKSNCKSEAPNVSSSRSLPIVTHLHPPRVHNV